MIHQAVVRRLGTECKGRERVHDDIDPEDLDDGEWFAKPEQGRDEDKDAGTEVDRELEEDEPLDVLVERSSPQDGARDRGKGIVQEDDIACLPGNLRPGYAHGEAHVGVLECRCIVRPVTGDCDNSPVPLERLDEEELVHRFCPGHHIKVPRSCCLFFF